MTDDDLPELPPPVLARRGESDGAVDEPLSIRRPRMTTASFIANLSVATIGIVIVALWAAYVMAGTP